MIRVKSMKVEAKFRYLWLKLVTGVNLEEHCAKSLLGEYDARFSSTTKEIDDIELASAPFYYLCGVSVPYVWAKNFHLAFREKEGYIVEVKRNGIHIVIENAEEVTFSEADIPPTDPHIKSKTYRTCRNWQFAHKVKHGFTGGGNTASVGETDEPQV